MEHQSMSDHRYETDKRKSGVPFASDDDSEQALWQALADVAQPEPPPRMRRRFYGELDRIGRSTPLQRGFNWLGLIGQRGIATALGCVIVGVVAGMLSNGSRSFERAELTDLQQQVAQLNR